MREPQFPKTCTYAYAFREPAQTLHQIESIIEERTGIKSSLHLLMLYQKCLNPVVVALLIDPVGDRHRLLGNLEPFAEGPGEALQLGPGQGPQAGVEVPDRVGIEGLLARISRG
jgi:hypothetical protein